MNTTTNEERFFGVSTPVQIPDKAAKPEENPEDSIELEIVDDTPKQPQKVEKEGKPVEDDEELSDYSDKVRKRINKLKYEQHEANRQREAAERMREEAVRVAQQLAAKNQQYEALIQRGESALVSQIKSKSVLALDGAKRGYKEAYESGDTDKIVEAQEKLLLAQTEAREADRYERELTNRARPQQQPPQQQAPQQQPVAPQPSQKALDWTKKNPWFGPKGNREMTALAYGVHESLIRDQGVTPDTEEYYEKIDAAMRSRFPENFESEQEPSARTQRNNPPPIVVAPANRNNGARPRKVQLTATQVSLAKRLGLTPEQYAKQLIKESSNG
jgi:hypothetical protein